MVGFGHVENTLPKLDAEFPNILVLGNIWFRLQILVLLNSLRNLLSARGIHMHVQTQRRRLDCASQDSHGSDFVK